MGEKVVGYTTSGSFSGGGGEGIYWDESAFSEFKITKEQYTKCVQIIWDFEVGTPDADWRKCENVGEGAGISYGPYQFTEKSGLLAKVVSMYLSTKGSSNYNDHDKVLSNTKLAE